MNVPIRICAFPCIFCSQIVEIAVLQGKLVSGTRYASAEIGLDYAESAILTSECHHIFDLFFRWLGCIYSDCVNFLLILFLLVC